MVKGDPETGMLLRAISLDKSFNSSGARIEILKGATLEMAHGETVAVVGASGIGKSTLLHIIGTLDRADSGTLLFKDEDIFHYHNEKLAKFRNESIGFVFQFHHLLPEFSAVENVMMPALINGMRKETARKSADEILIRIGLKDRLMHKVTDLSGGEQQRVALARALVLKPPILLADEPTGNLDRRNSDQVHELLLELNQEFHMAMVTVTHNMELAALMSRRVTIIDGKLEELT